MPEKESQTGVVPSPDTAGAGCQPESAAEFLLPSANLDGIQLSEREYINAFILNEQNEALVLEQLGAEHNRRVDWRMLHGWLGVDEDPLTAGQRYLHLVSGYRTEHWFYLGSYSGLPAAENLVGHLFFARNASLAAGKTDNSNHEFVVRWLPLGQVRYGLIDGRINKSSCALTVSLSLLTMRNLP